MAESSESINAVQRELALNRAQLTEARSELQASLDVPARVGRTVKRTVMAHPVAWALLAVAGGFVIARALPLAVGVLRSAGSRRLLGTVLGTVAPVALRAGLNAFSAWQAGGHFRDQSGEEAGDFTDAEGWEHRPPDPPPPA